jgi:hypothetical protein
VFGIQFVVVKPEAFRTTHDLEHSRPIFAHEGS